MLILHIAICRMQAKYKKKCIKNYAEMVKNHVEMNGTAPFDWKYNWSAHLFQLIPFHIAIAADAVAMTVAYVRCTYTCILFIWDR